MSHCYSCNRELICPHCDNSHQNQGLKRSFIDTFPGGEECSNRLVQRQRTIDSISNVSDRVGELTINDNNSVYYPGEDTSTIERVEEFMHGTSTVIDAISSFIPCGEMIAKILKIGEEIISLYNKAEHNKEICNFFKVRVDAAMYAINNLKANETLLLDVNYSLFKEFVICMQKIKHYVSEISQLGKMKGWLQGNMIEQKFQELTTEFEGYMQSLKFTLDLQFSHDLQDSLRMVAKEVRDVKEFLSRVQGGIADSSNQNISPTIPQVLKMNIGYQKKQYNGLIGSIQLLNEDSYVKTINGNRRKITKRCNKYHEEVAFKEFAVSSEKSEKEICQQVNILERLSESQHIIKFYGIAKEDSCYFLVTEWMENGNLLEYYEKYTRLSWERKLDFALDICRGLIFLNAVKIFHHDLRGANMLVDKNHKVKVANFGLSRRFDEITRNIKTSLETMRYMAPEKLQKGEKHRYDIKCEIYSLGALLWEIAEERVPYSGNDYEFPTIRDFVIENRRESLSYGTPEIWKTVINSALTLEPKHRPAISEIFNMLHKYHEISQQQSGSQQSGSQSTPIEIDTDDEYESELDVVGTPLEHIMSVQDAIIEHKNGNKQTAWDWFSYHAENGDMLAKFWVGYYLFHSEIDSLKYNIEENLIRAAQLFKETADNGKAEAQLRYGTCLWLGKGVKTNYNEAIRYLTLAAENGNVNAMYNVGSAYYSGKGVEINMEKGAHYLKMAARKRNQKAIDMCTKHGIS